MLPLISGIIVFQLMGIERLLEDVIFIKNCFLGSKSNLRRKTIFFLTRNGFLSVFLHFDE